MKRASPTGQVGSVAQDAVKLEFSKMGWGPIPVTEHDDGTDFYVQVRDVRLTSLGLLIGVQVKNEKKYFEPGPRANALTQDPPGWWYRSNQADVGYWLNHAVPHVVALYDRDTGVSFWGHVTPDSVRYTEKGASVWIPAQNELGPSGRDQLLTVATTARAAPLWAGSSWDGLSAFHPSQRLRLALVTPRVAAPHRNRKVDTVSVEEAIAALMMCRWEDVELYESNRHIPDTDARLAAGGDWWILDALMRYLTDEDLSLLPRMLHPEQPSRTRAAATALWIALLLERGEVVAAERVADECDWEALDDPVDQAWLRVHRSRILLELGHTNEALPLALQASAIGVIFPEDPSAVAIRAAALSLVLECDWTHDQGAQMVKSNDSAPTWWRGEQRGWALAGVLQDQFAEWSGSPTRREHEEKAWRRLRALTLAAGVAADRRAWASASTHLAAFSATMRERALSDADYARILDDFRLAGAQRELELALDKLQQDGPIRSIAAAAEAVDLFESTRSCFKADILLVHRGADLLDAATTTRHAVAALALLSDRAPRNEHPVRDGGERELVELLGELWPELELDVRAEVLTHLVQMAPVTHQLDAEAVRSLLSLVDTAEWRADHIDRINQRVGASEEVDTALDHEVLLRSWDWVLAKHGDRKRFDGVQRAVSGGSMSALAAVRKLSDLTPEAAAGLVDHLRRSLHERVEAARNAGSIQLGGHDPAVTLMRLNHVFPELADWEPLRRLLAGPAAPEHLWAFLDEIASTPDDIPRREVSLWMPLLERLAVLPPTQRRGLFTAPDIATRARRSLFAVLDPLENDRVLAERLTSGEDGLLSVARAIGLHGNRDHAPALATLSVNENPRLQAAAAAACVRWLLRDVAPEVARTILEPLLERPGRRIVAAVMRAIPHQPDVTSVAWVLEGLATHPSASVRRRVAGLIANPEVCRCHG